MDRVTRVLCIVLASACLALGQDPDRRSPDRYGEPLPTGSYARYGTLRFRSAEDVQAALLLPDGASFVTATTNEISVWEVSTGRKARVFPVQGGCGLAVSPDGASIAVGMRAGAVGLLRLESGEQTWQVEADSLDVRTLAFAPDGSALAVGTQTGSVRILDSATGQELRSLQDPARSITAIAWSPDGKWIAFGGSDRRDDLATAPRVHLVETATWEEQALFEGHSDWISSLAFTPRGITLASASRDGAILLRDVPGGKELASLGRDGEPVGGLRFAADGGAIFATGRGMLTKWGLGIDPEPERWVTPEPDSRVVDFAPGTGTALVVKGQLAYPWQPGSTEEPLVPPGHTSDVRAVLAVPGPDLVVTGGGDGTVRLWAQNDGEPVGVLDAGPGAVDDLALAADGKSILVMGGKDGLSRWDVEKQEKTWALPENPRWNSRRLSADGTTHILATDGRLRAIDANTGDVTMEIACDPARLLAVSADGRALAIEGDQEAQVIAVPSGDRLQTLPSKQGAVPPCLFSPDGHLLLFRDRANRLCLWELVTGSEVLSIGIEQQERPALAFSPDGRLLAVTRGGGKVVLFDTSSGEELLQLEGHEGRVLDIALDPHREVLVTCGTDGTGIGWSLSPIHRSESRGLEAKRSSWNALASDDEAEACAELDRLRQAPGHELSDIRSRLRSDPRLGKDVRKHVDNLLKGNDAARAKAEQALRDLGADALPALGEALSTDLSKESREWIERFIEAEKSPNPVTRGDTLRRLRLVRLMEWLGTTEASEVLGQLASGPEHALEVPAARRVLDDLSRARDGRTARILPDAADGLPDWCLARLGSASFLHEGDVSCVAWSHDGRTIAAAEVPFKVRLWDAESGVELRCIDQQSRAVHSMAFSPDDKALLIDALNGVCAIDIESARLTNLFEAAEPSFHFLAVSPADGRIATAGEEGPVRMWEWPSLGEVAGFDPAPATVCSLAFSRDGLLVAAGDKDGVVHLLDAGTGTTRRRLEGHTPGYGIHSLAFSPDGRTLVSSAHDATTRWWDVGEGTLQRTLDSKSGGGARILFSPQGETLASLEGCVLVLRDGSSAREVCSLPLASGAGHGLAFSPDGRRLAMGHLSAVVVCDTAQGRFIDMGPRHLGAVLSISVSEETGMIATGGADGTLRLWVAADGRPIRALGDPGSPLPVVAFAPDGREVVGADASGQRTLWRPGWGDRVEAVPREGPRIIAAAVSRDGARAASLTAGRQMRVEVLATGEVVTSFALPGEGASPRFAFSPDGTILATIDQDGTTRVWDASNGRQCGEDLKVGANPAALAISPRGDLIAVALGPSIAIIDRVSGGAIMKLEAQGEPPVLLSFGASSRWLAAAGSSGVRIWDLATRRPLASFLGHKGAVTALCFMRDGRRLVTGGEDGMALVWDLAPALLEDPSELGLECAWAALASEDAPTAHRACNRLSRQRREELAWLKSRLLAPSIALRQARILVHTLLEAEGDVRAATERNLRQLGSDAVPALREALDGAAGSRREERLNPLLRDLDHPMRLTPGETLQRVRAVRALERNGSIEAHSVLQKLVEWEPHLRETREAQASLARVRRRLGYR